MRLIENGKLKMENRVSETNNRINVESNEFRGREQGAQNGKFK